ncbi:DUF6879 family protein [Saccharothrix deserti]|uniref:DUF6879 family protein n=1 Tax=Saccharothrix deserti TaxID=2593674 RepID=UPI00131C99E5|nr:DUF6879 family protein [Saccharothrix deserti]
MTGRLVERAGFERLFDDFHSSAWRLEIQGTYDEPEEREPLRRFLAGEPDDLEWMADWFEWVTEQSASGRRIGRVRVLTEPLTDYLRFELSFTGHAVDAGEDIRLLTPADAARLDLPREDFWFFDDHLVAVLRFGDTGVATAELIDDPAEVNRYRAVQHRALSAAVPYREWAARQP